MICKRNFAHKSTNYAIGYSNNECQYKMRHEMRGKGSDRPNWRIQVHISDLVCFAIKIRWCIEKAQFIVPTKVMN